MSRAALAGVVVAIASLAFASGAQAASVRWGEDWRWGPQIWIDTEAGETVDLTIRAEGSAPASPEEVVVENAAGTVTTPGMIAAPGSCDSEDSACTSACRAETPSRARCSIYDGFTREPKPLNPFESPRHYFRGGVWLWLDSGDDRVTVPADNPVRFRMRGHASAGSNTWDLSRVIASVESFSGDTITSGVGANVGAAFWGSNTFNAVNGRADGVYCPYGDDHPQTMRIDAHDDVGDCGGDIQPPPSPVGPVPAPPDADETLGDQSTRIASARRCLESNLVTPGSCLNP